MTSEELEAVAATVDDDEDDDVDGATVDEEAVEVAEE